MQIHKLTQTPAPEPETADLRPLFHMHAELCRAMASEHRQAILHAICNEEKCVSDLAAAIGISVHNVSQHLRVLKEQRLVAARKEGHTVYYRITNQKFIEACALMRQALIEQHREQGELLHATGLYEADVHAASSSRQA
jgi:DNA-binding transcriptional ArsR family regulator